MHAASILDEPLPNPADPLVTFKNGIRKLKKKKKTCTCSPPSHVNDVIEQGLL